MEAFILMDRIKNTKDNVVGKVKEATGKAINNDRLELSGKLQTFQSKVEEGMENLKEELAEKANDVIEWTKPEQNNKQI
jgi:uncharacterized protein YjbJ (UPF0337 family)